MAAAGLCAALGGSNEQIAVKVIDHRGNELMVVRSLAAPKKKR